MVMALTSCGGGGASTEPVTSSDPASTEPVSTSTDTEPAEITYDGYDGYYESLNPEQRGARFGSSLHKLMLNTHSKWIKYGDVRDYAQLTDMDPDNSDKLLNFYTSRSVGSYQSREHVWPCANSNGLWGRGASGEDIGDTYIGGGSDLYHVRNCDGNVNSYRSNDRYYEFKDGEDYTLATDGGPYSLRYSASGKKAEPADEWKGDIARIVVYLYVHYGAYKQGDDDIYTGDLDLTDVIFKAPEESMEDVYQRLCDWNRLDPVSEQEVMRNTNVMKVQGNRNPFVDYPVMMERLFNIEYD